MPSIAANIDKKTLISLLAGLSIAAFIFHHLTNKAIQTIARSGVYRIEKRNQKLHLFEGQEELTRNSYTRYIDTIASVNFVLLGTVILFVIYPEVAITFLIYILACIVATLTVRKVRYSDTDAFTHSIQKKLPNLSGIGFLLIFSWVLTDYIFFSIPESFIALLISVILGRQLLTRSSVIINSLLFFSQQKQKLRALLFHREAFQPEIKGNSSIWNFLDRSTPSYQLLQDKLKSIPNSFADDAELNWQDSGISGITFLTAKTKISDKKFLVKIFEKKKTAEAHHEAALLLNAPETLPCPKLIVDTIISGFPVHILDCTGYSLPTNSSDHFTKDELALSVSDVPVPNTLCSRYVRSHSMLWDQLSSLRLQQFELISKDPFVITNFKSKLPKILSELKSLPLRLHNPQLSNNNLQLRSPKGEMHLVHWGKWSLAPLGATLTKRSINKTSLKVPEIREDDETENTLPPVPDPMTALLSHRLCKQANQQLLLSAMDTMKELSNRFT